MCVRRNSSFSCMFIQHTEELVLHSDSCQAFKMSEFRPAWDWSVLGPFLASDWLLAQTCSPYQPGSVPAANILAWRRAL